MSDALETLRCILSAPEANDIEQIVKLYTDARVREFLGGPADADTIRTQFRIIIDTGTTKNLWVVRCKANRAFIGAVSLDPHHDGTDTEISYQLLPKWWGEGYAQEAVQAVINYALKDLTLSRVIAETQTANVASCRLLEHIGMHFERHVERFGAMQSIYTTTTRRQV
ncbi:MAG: GNAT family N-acetyltransferase [Chloroflexi bacterium AL-W]|nr:GNAT family N-acetyltransferase [Chloroflexi bacterium AL-N1]NOK68675.1 GNAT family N-acetyltransferase [Chloroflexi bacterium AL-N10]NOK76161.1 GNAT family N-acetyltransferase [Chloroflexi bacterium AL-N5]NOK84202.1 GNAT family N-acetyltransferase [Chloroflexi bacterium AL-W]NOK91299.1 GNAT family N-acetyltransferase [Chloroflexi bacterium AL-N15]